MNTVKDNPTKKDSPKSKGNEMYFSPEVAEKFATLEQNEKNLRVAKIIDRVLIQEIKDFKRPLLVAELGGGAHPDRYDEFFEKLMAEPKSRIDWVDVSSVMLGIGQKYLASEKYQKRAEIINFIESDILEYLAKIPDESLDLAIMKYTLSDLADLEKLFGLLAKKLKKGGKLAATAGDTKPELRSHSTNARYLYQGKKIPDGETRTLKDGDSFTIKFLKVSGDPNSGYLEGAETVKYFHSAEKIKKIALSFNFKIFLDDWKDFVDRKNHGGEEMDQEVLVLTKK